ncbi:MAG: lipoate--protein ligase family protein [Anaerolineaceae bacterium]|nr:lipoate--protein ligase family protein [Anaerolineaceae bacterium]
MKYRMISFQYFDAYMNMAIDEAIMEGVRLGTTLPTIRFYGWSPSAVSIGIFQGIHNEVNLQETKKQGVDVVRRMTGGGAVYHDKLGEVTYSIIAPVDHFPSNIMASYELICADILSALSSMGIEAKFVPVNDILVKEQKISGNAQTRRDGILLQHGTILYQVDVETMFSLLNVSEQKISDKLIKSVKKRVTSVIDQGKATMVDLQRALESGFSQDRQIVQGNYTDLELERATVLVKEKFSSEAWNFRL